nr:hypothetical protein [uncultured Undibacterium sp.]
MKRTHLSIAKQSGGISLLMTAVLMMGISLIGMSVLYYLRFSQWPMQESFNRWGQSLGVIQQEVKKGAGLVSNSADSSTLGEGLRKCKIKGKVVYSNVDCLDSNDTTRSLTLQDSRGFSLPPPSEKNAALTANSGPTIQEKMMDRAIDKATK